MHYKRSCIFYFFLQGTVLQVFLPLFFAQKALPGAPHNQAKMVFHEDIRLKNLKIMCPLTTLLTPGPRSQRLRRQRVREVNDYIVTCLYSQRLRRHVSA